MGTMNRRKMLGTTTALVGGVVAGVSREACWRRRSQKPRAASAPATSPNLNPPVRPAQGRHPARASGKARPSSFLGIRYAEAERFGHAQGRFSRGRASRTPRCGARSVRAPEQTNVSADELVFPHRYWIANEHCQYLNVWTQNLTPAAKKPVMVWMHGGGFTNGSSMESYAYDGRTLSEFGDVVVVSINHRLNILGTLDLSAYGPQYANSR